MRRRVEASEPANSDYDIQVRKATKVTPRIEYLVISFLAGVLITLLLVVPIPDIKIIEPESDKLRRSQSDTSEKDLKWYEKSQPKLSDWPLLERRLDVIPILEKLKLKRGIEVGVQKGILAKKSLDMWPSCEEYKLVDLWSAEAGYVEPGGHSKSTHDGYLREAQQRMARLKREGVPEFFIMRSTEAAKKAERRLFRLCLR